MGGREEMVDDTADVWRDLRVVLKVVGGNVPFVRYGATVGRNRDWKVCFILQGPKGAVTIEWEG